MGWTDALEGMQKVRDALMFEYLSEEALSLTALARRDSGKSSTRRGA
jgi:hypothetical protein